VVELCRIVALADNGNTECLSSPLADRLNRIPVEILLFGDAFYVIGGAPELEDLFGGRLVAIDGHPIQAVRAAAHSLIGGTSAHRDVAMVPYLGSPEVMHALGIGRAPNGARYRFIARDGRAIERYLPAASPRATSWRWLVPEDRAPWAFRQLDQTFRWRDAPELDASVIQLRYVGFSNGQSIVDFLKTAEQRRTQLGRRNVVIDLRFDFIGGDFTAVRDFMTALPGRVGPNGRIFVFLGPGTFSAGIGTAAYLKQAGRERVVLVGEPPGDRLEFFAEGGSVTLPQSKLTMLVATQRHDYRDGCRAYSDCFVGVAQPGRPTGSPPATIRAVARRPIAISDLNPDIPAPWTIEDFAQGRDPAIEAVAVALARSPH
jgi:hypothetical protein